MVSDKNFFFCCNRQSAGKCHPGKEIFQAKLLRNVFFFVYRKFGWDLKQKYIVYSNK